MFYLLIASDKELISGAKISAFEIIKKRLALGKWPLYKGTKADSIQSSDKCLVYAAGYNKYSQHIVAKFTVNNIKNLSNDHDYEDELFGIISIPATKVIEFNPTNIGKPVNFKHEINNISFIPKNTIKWGVFFMGGVKKINKQDYEYLSKKI